jgi:endonuclease/exonuclease/phosphatase family metal-dependent hydrolase
VPGTFKVASYNIHKGVGTDRKRDPARILRVLQEVDADIVCLQEVRSHHRKLAHYFTRWPDLDQAGYLSPDLEQAEALAIDGTAPAPLRRLQPASI